MRRNRKQRLIIVSAIGILVLIGVRCWPYFLSNIPLGYDPGLYRYFFLDYFHAIPHFDYHNIANWVKDMYEPFLGFLGIVLQLIGYSVDFLLSWGLVFFSVITSAFIYLVLKKYSKTCAWIGVVLFLLSIVQYKAFRWNYYKQIIGIIFILSSISFVEKKQYVLLVPVLIGAIAIQRPTGIFLLLVLLIYILGTAISKKTVSTKLIISLAIGGLGALILYLPLLNHLIIPLLKPLVGTAFIDGTSGTFFTKDLFVYYSIPFILLAAYGFYLRIQKKIFDIVDAGFIVGVLWIGLQLLFYNRMLIFTDLFLILMSARTLGTILTKKRGWIVLVVVLLYQSVQYVIFVHNNNDPLIPQEEFLFLNNINTLVPEEGTMMVTHKNYSPRVVGYTMKPTIAPGLLDRDPWSFDQRIQWREGDGAAKCALLQTTYSETNKNIYLRLGGSQPQENLSSGNCFHLLYASGHYGLFTINLDNHAE